MKNCNNCGKPTNEGDFCGKGCKSEYMESMHPETLRGIDEGDLDKPFFPPLAVAIFIFFVISVILLGVFIRT